MNDELKEFFTKALVISVFLAHAGTGKDITKKMSRLRRQIRLHLKKDTHHFKQEMVEISMKTDEAYAAAVKNIPKGKHLNVLLSMAMDVLWAELDGNKYRNRWFGDKSFNDARNSLAYGAEGFASETEDTYWLIDEFLSKAGYPRESAFQKKIRLAKKIKEQNLILEGN